MSSPARLTREQIEEMKRLLHAREQEREQFSFGKRFTIQAGGELRNYLVRHAPTLIAAAERDAEDRWRPIETMPVDGSYVQVRDQSVWECKWGSKQQELIYRGEQVSGSLEWRPLPAPPEDAS